MRKQKGFSLIELLIVVAIILIIAAIAIPNLLRARMSAADSAAASTIRTLNTAEVSYATNYPSWGYAETFTKLGPNTANPGQAAPDTGAGLIDGVFTATAAGPSPKGGYQYWIGLGGTNPSASGAIGDYSVTAEPLTINTTGTNVFCSHADAVIRSQMSVTPTPPIAIATNGNVDVATCTGGTYAPLKN